MWHTTVSTPDSTVVYWERYGNGDKKAVSATIDSYLVSAGYDHTALLNGLKPDTEYMFTCGSSVGMSQNRTFRTASRSHVRVAMYGDMGVRHSGQTNKMLRRFIDEDRFDWIFHVGDISYGDDYDADSYEMVWNMFFENMQELMGRRAYMVCPGNHEYSCEHQACLFYSTNFTVYNSRFRMPGSQSGSNTSMWYSFDYANIHFIGLSTETDYPNAPFPSQFGDQLAWLESDLQAANSNPEIDWIVATGHRPMYSSAVGNSVHGQPVGTAYDIQQAFEPLFHQYGVDLFVAGHVHSYQRTLPIYNSQPVMTYTNPNTTIYIVAGAAGCEEGIDFAYDIPSPNWSASIYFEDFGFGVLSTDGPNELTWDYYRSSDGQLIDSFTLTHTS